MELQKPVGFLKQAYYQGHGRHVNQLLRITIKFCKSSGNSREMRKFIETRLVDMARDNPGTAIYVKPRLFKAPVISAEYMNGQRHYLSLYGMSHDQVGAWLDWFISRSGEELYKLKLPVTTFTPSVQGQWTPFTNREPSFNITKFPSKELGKHTPQNLSATDQLLELSKETASGQQQQQQQD